MLYQLYAATFSKVGVVVVRYEITHQPRLKWVAFLTHLRVPV